MMKSARCINAKVTGFHAIPEFHVLTYRMRAEAITPFADGHVPETIYQSVRQAFSDKELVDSTIAIVAINGWNRLAISFGSTVGGYQPSPNAVRT
ncbi:MAG: hypothetical protein ABI552_19245 [Casimicrobiaceae bacterium]